MLTRIFFLFFFLVSATGSFAQQWYLSPVLHGRNMYDVSILNRSDIIVGGGSEQNDSIQDVFRSENGGLNWGFSSNQGGGYIRSMDFWDEQDGLAVGYAGKILKTTNSANSWDVVYAPGTLNQRNYTTVLYRDAQTVFAFGGRYYNNDSVQTIIKSTDGGTNWTNVLDQAGQWLKGAYFINATKGFAVGTRGTILKTTDGGDNWTQVSSPVNSRNFNAVYFNSATTGYIVGGIYAEFDTLNSVRTILKTIDGGDSWSVVTDEAGGWLNAIEFIDQNTGYIVGDGSTVLKTINGGTNWVSETIPGSNWYSNFSSVEFLNADFGIVTGFFGEEFLYSNEPLPEAVTLPASITTVSDTNANALLRATINTNGLPVTYNFKYSTNADFSVNNGFAFSIFYPESFSSNSPAEVQASVNDLLPQTTYYYFITVTSAAGTVNGDTLSFFTDAAYHSIHTYLPLSNNQYTVFSGFVGHPEQDMNLFFEYGTTTQFGSTVQATPSFVDDTLNYSITDTVFSLQQNTIYYYRLKAITQNDTFYANTVSFFSGRLFDNFETTDATDITGISAVLNAHIAGFMLPLANITFQYGTNMQQLNNWIFADPQYIDNTASYALSAAVSSLIPDTWYYFQLTAQTETGSITSNKLSFYTGDIPLVLQAHPATNVSENTATLNGYAEDFEVNATLIFEYGLTPSLGSSVGATPATITDTLGHNIIAYVNNLNPSSVYWFRLTGQTQSGTIYSSLQSFNTSFSSNFFSTMPATEVAFNDAVLHGVVSHLNFPVTLSFEYGLTDTFGSVAAAIPATVSDTLEHIISADVSALLDSSIYYFRMKATSGNQVFYTAPRKVYTGAPEILNWDFEAWQTDTFVLPPQWNIADERKYERVPGHTGNYALKVSGKNFAILGYPGDGGNNPIPFFGGCAFSSRPDSIIMYLDYELHPLDSGMFLLALYSGDEFISNNFYFVTGNTAGSFQRFAFPIDYMTLTVPDSLVMGFTPFNAFSEVPLNINRDNNFITIDDIDFSPGATHACNTGFENWFDFPCEGPEHWHYVKTVLVDPDNVSGSLKVVKTDGVAPGEYAAKMKNFSVLGMWAAGELANERSKDFGGENKHGMHISQRYQHLNGYYKYTADSDEDTLAILVDLYKDGLEAGRGTFYRHIDATVFTPFDVYLDYLDSTIVPDSVVITLKTNNNGGAMGYAELVIDKLSFDGFWGPASDTTGIIQLAGRQPDQVRIYPNPAKNNFTVELSETMQDHAFSQLMNINGQVVSEITFPAGQLRINFDASGLDAGIYFVRVMAGAKVFNKKIVVIK